jgi:hypothetical protein
MVFECASNAKLQPDDVALVVHRGDIGRHIGFAVFTSKGKHEFLHLAWHKKVRLGDYPLDRCAIVGKLRFDRVGLMTLKKALWNIGKKVSNKATAVEIPYGVNIDPSKGSFKKDGTYHPPQGKDGLTCATFVSEICRGVGLPLLNEGDWKPRLEDAEWIDQICVLLSRPESGADGTHIAHVRASFDGLRIRPEEVAAAAALWTGRPVDFESSEAEGKALVAKLDQCCPIEVPPAPTPGSVAAVPTVSIH